MPEFDAEPHEHDMPLLLLTSPPLNHARQHNAPVPQPGENEYGHYFRDRNTALHMAVLHKERELLSDRGPGVVLMLESGRLTVQRSQSKLKPEELSELQRATHFDKKELQQWYKGTRVSLLALR